MPNAFDRVNANWTAIDGNYEQGDVKVGMVLDAVGRGIYSMNQCKYFLELIQQGKIKDGDTIYLQDYWTPGIESIFYALDLYKIIDDNLGIKDLQIPEDVSEEERAKLEKENSSIGIIGANTILSKMKTET